MLRNFFAAHLATSLSASIKVRQFSLLVLFILVAAWLGAHVGSAFPLYQSALADDLSVTGLITGTVYQDYNANGRRDTAATIANAGGGETQVAFDRGIAGVTVTAYAADGSSAGSATTGADGSYSLNATGSGPYRLEFTNLPAGYFPGPVGPDSATNVRFISGATASNQDFGIVLPMAYCQDDPTLITSCFGFGDQSFVNPVLVSFPNSSGSSRTTGGAPFNDFDSPAHGNIANSDQVGTVWGIAYARGTKTLYVSSFMKKHSGFGPNGPGAIYQVNPATGASSLFFDAGALAGANPHDETDYDRDNGNISWDAVGKLSFGGIALNGAETRLFAMNLFDRKLYELATDGSGSIRTSAAITSAPGCASGDVRPFAVHWNAGQLYVGVTCTAESTQSAADLQGYVYRVDPATLALDAAPLFQFPLNYPRRCADSAQNGPANCFAAAWRPWTPTFANIANQNRAIYPQPWLTDIAFDRGDLIIGLRDRAGDQFGIDTLDNPGDGNRTYGVSAGDTLRAVSNGAGGFVLESNGRAGGQGTAPQNTGEGPGGGEFYFGDNSIPFLDENGMGALLQIPGHVNVLVNSTDLVPFDDPNTLFDGGTIWHNNNTGARSKSYRIYDGNRTSDSGSDFGKANGLGDLVALCDPAPIELGNRVWNDLDSDGIQDANEPGLAGLTVQLIKDGQVVGSTTTSANGTYYFNASNVAGGVLPNMDYQICLTSLPANSALTLRDNDATANGDARDSDAALTGGQACISLTTGGPGATNHSYDIGLVFTALPTIACPAPVSQCVAANATSGTVTYAEPTTTGTGVTVTCTPASGSSFALGTTTVTCTASNSAGQASCSFTVTVTDAPTITCPADIKVAATSGTGAAVTFTTPTGGGRGTTVSCDRASGSTFPVGTTKVTCTATNRCGTVSCSFNVLVEASAKCDTLCYRSPQWWLLNLDRLPGGTVFIYGQNGGASVSTSNWRAIQQALRGNPTGFGLTPLQVFNQEYVAAQLNILSYGGSGSPTVANTMWANLSCYEIRFAPITLSNGAVLTPDSMVKELYMHITLAIQARREADLVKLTQVLDLLNGNSLLYCN